MSIQKVLRMGHPLLRQPSLPLPPEEIASDETRRLLVDMLETMQARDGIGIAAPQIGVLKRVALIGIEKDNPRYKDAPPYDLITVINPVIHILGNSRQSFVERCLSVPGLSGEVVRPDHIRVDYLDESGNRRSIEAKGLPATVFQHEIDHLDGILYVDRMKDLATLSFDESE